MFLKLRRLFFKPFGGKANLASTLIITLIAYLFLRTYFFSSYHDDENIDVNNPLAVQNLQNDNTIVTRKTQKTIDSKCEINEACSDDSIPYKIVSGEGFDKYPLICFDGKLIIDKSLNNVGRGFNFVLIRQKNNSYQVEALEIFDTYSEDARFFRFLKTSTKDGDVVMMTSFDEVANSLREISYNILEFFGAQNFKSVKFRDSYSFIGQRGIPKGKAIEVVENKGKKDFGAAAKSSGCLKLPMGPITPMPVVEAKINDHNQIVVGEIKKNCGLPEPCPFGEFPIHVFTGINDKDEPKICVDDKYIMGRGLNDAGRGLNVVIVGNGKDILKTAHFDTYQDDSTNLEIFLENLPDNVIIIICTFDEASSKLGQLAKNLLFDLGSGLIQNLRHRDAWYMVGQKGINGFSPIEDISYAGADHAYPKPLDKRICVPKTIHGMKIRPDPLPISNEQRREFCTKFDGYGDFCFDSNIDKQIKPVPVINKTLEDHVIYSTPILIISGLSHNALRMNLETIVMQPGLNPAMVFVAIDEKLEETSSLVKLFGFNVLKIASSVSYLEQMHKSIDRMWEENSVKDKDAIIIIEEDILVSPDFLYYFSQVYEIFMNDDNLASVSSWNPNSFLELDGSEKLAYRTNDFPGLAFLLKKKIYEKYLKNNYKNCCNKRAWYNWNLNDKNLKSLVPDVSRSFRRPYNGMNNDREFLENLFNRQRKTNLLPFPEIVNIDNLVSNDAYETSIKNDLSRSIEFKDLESCNEKNVFITYPKEIGNIYKIIYVQDSVTDYKSLKKLCKCFGLFHDENNEPKGLYNGILRFYAKGNNFIFIGSMNQLILS